MLDTGVRQRMIEPIMTIEDPERRQCNARQPLNHGILKPSPENVEDFVINSGITCS